MNPGSIVQCRSREWVLLPSDKEDLLLLRPLTGATDEVVAVHKGLTDLLGYSFPEERVRSAKFPPPTPGDLSNVAGAHLLWQAARLTLREGATPLRSLGRVSTPLLAEEVQVMGHTGPADKPTWINPDEVLTLLEKAHADANIRDEEKRELTAAALAGYEKLDAPIKQNLQGRAEALTEAHRRIRQAVSLKVRGLTVKPQLPPDLLGLLVLQPAVAGS